MRNGEESLEGRRQLNALKFVFPLDADNVSFGARTFLASQCNVASLFDGCFESDHASTDRDLKLINLLDEAPTLDPFLLQCILKKSGFDVAPCYFSASPQVLRYQTALVDLAANPIIEVFNASAPMIAGADQLAWRPHFVRNHSNINASTIVDDENVCEQKLSECFFNWKIVLFYRLRLLELTSTTKHLLTSLERLRSNSGPRHTTLLIEKRRRRIYDTLLSALTEAQLIVDDYDLLHFGVLNGPRPGLFGALLFQSRTYMTALGARISRLDDALGFWSAHAPGAPDCVETYRLECFLEAFERQIASDLPLPIFTPVGPRLGLSNWTIAAPV